MKDSTSVLILSVLLLGIVFVISCNVLDVNAYNPGVWFGLM